MDSNVQINFAICKDSCDIYNINKLCLPVFYSKREYVMHILDKNVILLKATSNDNIIAYILAKWYSSSRLHIMSFAVMPEYRKHGIGKSLIDTLIKIGSKVNANFTQLTLYVQQSNETALKFYKNNSFIEGKYMKNYYGIGDHGYCMIHNFK